jgi:hypothetical protein
MFNGEFLEATEQAAKLPEDDPHVFGLFLGWLYVGRLTPNPPTDEERKRLKAMSEYIKLYCFAEKIVSPELMDRAMTVIISTFKHHSRLPSVNQIELAYEISQPSSRLRQLMAQTLHYTIATNITAGTNDALAKLLGKEEIAADFVGLVRNSNGKSIQSPTRMSTCLFHVHGDDEECNLSKVFGL